MNKEQILRNLHELDSKLLAPLEIEIAGSSAAILKDALKRATRDIDVVHSSMPLKTESMRQILDAVQMSPPNKECWLNNQCEEVIKKRFPKVYKFDIEALASERFDKLRVAVISKADFVICKLLIEENERRNHDFSDIMNLVMNEMDAKSVYDKLDILVTENHALALKAEGTFKQLRPDFVYDKNNLPYSNANEIVNYCLHRYGLTVDSAKKDEWYDDIDNARKRPAIIIGRIDYDVGCQIEKGNIMLAQKDKSFRKAKVINYGFDI